MAKFFLTGVTGYVGGDALYVLANSHPEYEITALIRDEKKAAAVASAFPKVNIIIGDLSNAQLLEEESAKVDVVLNFADADHLGAAKAILKGLSQHNADKAGFLIHTSGTGILGIDAIVKNIPYGDHADKVFNDWDGIGEVTSLPDQAPHRLIDRAVLEFNSPSVKTAIVCPPCIYGAGRGPVNGRSIQIPELAKSVISSGHGIVVGKGQNLWSSVNVRDLSQLYVALVEAAVSGGGKATWGSEGYYFAMQEQFEWGEIAGLVAKAAAAAGLIKDDTLKSFTYDEANDFLPPYGGYVWGTNSRSEAIRGKKLLGWEPKEWTIREEIPIAVQAEAAALKK